MKNINKLKKLTIILIVPTIFIGCTPQKQITAELNFSDKQQIIQESKNSYIKSWKTKLDFANTFKNKEEADPTLYIFQRLMND